MREFEFTGSPQSYVVPAGICRVRVEVVGGAGGGAGTAGAPGAGARAVATFEVDPGETLRVRVGGWGGAAVGSTPGDGGWNGGGTGGRTSLGRDGRPGKAGSGGGGATDVRRGGDELEHRIIVGGGGWGVPAVGSAAHSVPAAATAATRSGRTASPPWGGRTRRPVERAELGRKAAPRAVTHPITRFRRRPAHSGPVATGRRRGQRRRRRRRRALRRRRRRLQHCLQRRARRWRLRVRPCGDGLPTRCRRWLRAGDDHVRDADACDDVG